MIMLNSFLKSVRKNMQWLTAYYGCCCIKKEGEDVKENIKLFIESKKLNDKTQLEILIICLK